MSKSQHSQDDRAAIGCPTVYLYSLASKHSARFTNKPFKALVK